MSLTLPQKRVASDPSRFRVLITGRRFGKTTLAIWEVCRAAARHPLGEIWYVAPTYSQAKDNFWPKLKNKLISINWVAKINESELSMILRNGSIIRLKSANNQESLRGAGLDFLVMDEIADIKAEAFYEVLRPTLSDKQGSALFIGTPKGTGNWSYDLFEKGKSKKNWSSFTFTSMEGGILTPQEIEDARELLDARAFDQEYNASFVTTSNRVYYNFRRDLHVKEYGKETPGVLYTGWDFNIDPMSVVIFARHGNIIHAIDEIEIYGSNTNEAIEELRTRYTKQKIYAYPDPASRQRKTSAGGNTDLKLLKNAGFITQAPRRHNLVRDGVNAVNGKLLNSKGKTSFYVDPKCRRLIECLEKLNYKPGTSIPDKDSGFDHLTDAMRYYIDYEFPIKIVEKETEPQRWGHGIGAY